MYCDTIPFAGHPSCSFWKPDYADLVGSYDHWTWPAKLAEAAASRHAWNFTKMVLANEDIGLLGCGEDVPPEALLDPEQQEEEKKRRKEAGECNYPHRYTWHLESEKASF